MAGMQVRTSVGVVGSCSNKGVVRLTDDRRIDALYMTYMTFNFIRGRGAASSARRGRVARGGAVGRLGQRGRGGRGAAAVGLDYSPAA